MKKLVIKVIGVIFLVTFLIYLFYSPRLKFDVLENPNKGSKTNRTEQFKQTDKDVENPKPKKGVGTWIGKNIKTMTHHFGQADRTYPYKHGYKNYIFKKSNQYYIVSTKNNVITSVYATGKDVKVDPLKIGESAAHLFENTSINPEPTIKANGKAYKFEMSDEDLKTQTLIKYGSVYAQVYSDQQSNSILAVRFLDANTLATLQPYKLNSEENQSQIEEKTDDSIPYEQNPNQLITLYEVTNKMREMKGLKPLKINSDIARIASINLYEATDKGSDSVEFTENALTQQLDDNLVTYKSASQNVGYDFDDVPTLIHSWINSDIHRSRLLNNKYDEMGGEVMRDYYSLIFVEK
ncbi:CAP-associated domain-containing protein [Staphylococcus saccharolyticus]|uniref:CAP-associated domain-containing protein n=1 Tax=Staphylococcus saccharolyticus TaxID=33028 RepID=UPI00102DA548|nr:CAP domain-containing protein [Staphylococcus saccharolyticus]MBL7572957.1 SCP-like extracellular protein [Staphylococcus saccharolyticus]MBL7584107.1 SCP-like extracellular protein [Staphylococcus saccharolyticus]MBL7638574.1 SCP-like extracellular protein [Staphylococcus saccharolyticus]QRJ67929.1 SCP-like extracellular protein [Staphylococcus saccharolyticus]TAA93491.1 SCP-like extracellular protein [Staphylococcus saccharolyticus]